MHQLVKQIACAVTLALLIAEQASAGVVIFDHNTNGGLAGFNTAAGTPPVSIDFDGIAPGTNLNGMTIAGVTFQPSATGAPLIVVPGNDTFTPPGFFGVIDECRLDLRKPKVGRVIGEAGFAGEDGV
jgi:hypothetical protein